jgi:glycerol-3-phosphate dehydrogenase
VRKLCKSRNLLLRSYPSTVQEIRFYTTHERGFRHGLWKLLLGTLVYWLFGSFFTRPPRLLSRATMEREEPIVRLDGCDGGFEYSDAYLHDNDARFVWNFVRAALDHGALPPTTSSPWARSARASSGSPRARDVISGDTFTLRSKAIVNACGPFVDAHNALTGEKTRTATCSPRASTSSSAASRRASACSPSSPTTAASSS